MDQLDSEIGRLLGKVVDVLHDCGVVEPTEGSPVIRFMQPRILEEILPHFRLGESCTEEQLLRAIRDTASLSVKTGHPMFFNQLYGAVDEYGLAGAVVSEVLNTSAYTHEVAPVFSLTEREALKSSLDLVGFHGGDGIFTPGGSISNMYGIVLARYRKFPEVKETGNSSLPTLVIFTSQDSHYSISKGAHWLGIGTNNVVKVKSNHFGQMISSELEEAITKALSEGKVPLMVNCTAGTTVLGAFDPLNEIVNICLRYCIWLHVDACLGGSLLLSKSHKYLLDGINRADSVAWNPHKMLGAPLQCSLFLMRQPNLLESCNKAGASYLFQQDKMYDQTYDSGDKSVQCGRKVDAFKLWAMWKVRGNIGLEQLVNRAIHLANYFLETIRGRPGFKLVLEQFQTSNICFWYIPTRFRDKEETDSWWRKIGEVAPALKKRLATVGLLMIGYQPLEHRNFVNFFRLVVTCHPLRTEEQMDRVVELIEQYGHDL